MPKFLFIVAVTYTCLLIASSLFSLSGIPIQELSVSDKLLHAVAYFGLVLLWGAYMWFSDKRFSKRQIMIRTGVAAFLFGIIIEVLQGSLTDYREAELYDALANTVGIICGLALISLKKR